MISKEPELLTGGNMSAPVKKDGLVYKKVSAASETIHRLLGHVRGRGIAWVPKSYGIDKDNRHVLSFIEGTVPSDTPDWLWNEDILKDAAIKLRQWHDATADFNLTGAVCLLENDERDEVVCHSDFAPYNTVFVDGKIAGVIDFDVCAPGSRLWDISYSACRFVPILPEIGSELPGGEVSPFSKTEMNERLDLFLGSYADGNEELRFSTDDLVRKLRKRLLDLARWSADFGKKNGRPELIGHARMYEAHAEMIDKIVN